MSGQTRGRQRELRVVDWLRDRDWIAVRAHLSGIDILAVRNGDRPRLIEVKSTAGGPYERFGPTRRATVQAAARLAGGDAYLAWWPPQRHPQMDPRNRMAHMSWLRIDDKFARHPKIEALTDKEFRTWIGVLCYCAEYRNQGLIYKQTIARAVHGATPKFLDRCVDLGLLEPTTGSNGLQKGVHFQVHDFGKYNNNSDPQAAERMRKYREQHPRVSGSKWERTREAVYERDAGICVDCSQYTDDWNADHEPDRAELTKRGLSIYDIAYIYTRCHSCHAKKTRRETANQPNHPTEPSDQTTTPGSPQVHPPSRAGTHARSRPVPSLEQSKQAEAHHEQAGNETQNGYTPTELEDLAHTVLDDMP